MLAMFPVLAWNRIDCTTTWGIMPNVIETYKIELERLATPCLPAGHPPVPESRRLPAPRATLSPHDAPEVPQKLLDAEARRESKWEITPLHVLLIALVVAMLALMVSLYSLAFVGTHQLQREEPSPVPDAMEVSDVEFLPSTPEEALSVLSTPEPFDGAEPDMFDSIEEPDNEHVFAFSLSSAPAPSISASIVENIESAASALDGYPIGFLFMDIATGTGYARNIDERIYGASSFKAPLAAYVLSHEYDSGNLPDWRLEQVVESVEFSDNASFESLSQAYRHEPDFDTWLAELSIGNPEMFSLGDYATYSARDAAKLWSFIYAYMESGTSGAEILSKSTASTNVSFIREGVERATGTEAIEWETSDGALVMVESTGALVRNKAGWMPEEGVFASTSDNAIVTIGGRDYMMCIMSAAPAYGQYQEAVTELARALFEARSCLAGL